MISRKNSLLQHFQVLSSLYAKRPTLKERKFNPRDWNKQQIYTSFLSYGVIFILSEPMTWKFLIAHALNETGPTKWLASSGIVDLYQFSPMQAVKYALVNIHKMKRR